MTPILDSLDCLKIITFGNHLFGASVTSLNFHLKMPYLEFFEPVDTSLRHLFYLYSNLPKKHRELRSLYLKFQGQFETYGSGVKLLKGSVTRWINCEVCAIGHVIEKSGLYVEHLISCVVTTKNSIARATVEGKLKKLVDA